MSILKGKNASIKIGANTMIQTDTVTLTINDGNEEVTDHGDSYRTRESTVLDWSAVCEMFTDWTDIAQAAIKTAVLTGGSVTLNIYESATKYWSGTALIESVSQEAPVAGFVRTTVNFVGSGALTYN